MLKPFEEEWYKHIGDFLYQLLSQSEDLLEMIKDKNLYLCGIGRRGRAFLEWADRKGIAIKGVSDKHVDSLEIKKLGHETVGRKELLAMKDCMIVASNMDVYTEIRGKTKNEVLNLQEYCPL